MGLSLKTAPSVEPVLFAEQKTFMRETSAVENADITKYLLVARRTAEKRTWRQFITATWTLTFDSFPSGDTIEFPKTPLQTVTHVKYTDTSDVLQTFSSGSYQVVTDALDGVGYLKLLSGESWPSDVKTVDNVVTIEYVAGYGDAGTDVPEEAKMGIKYICADIYTNRTDTIQGTIVANIPHAADYWLRFVTARRVA